MVYIHFKTLLIGLLNIMYRLTNRYRQFILYHEKLYTHRDVKNKCIFVLTGLLTGFLTGKLMLMLILWEYDLDVHCFVFVDSEVWCVNNNFKFS